VELMQREGDHGDLQLSPLSCSPPQPASSLPSTPTTLPSPPPATTPSAYTTETTDTTPVGDPSNAIACIAGFNPDFSFNTETNGNIQAACSASMAGGVRFLYRSGSYYMPKVL
jgi:hypothetical protein